jgi:hypothetical protein
MACICGIRTSWTLVQAQLGTDTTANDCSQELRLLSPRPSIWAPVSLRTRSWPSSPPRPKAQPSFASDFIPGSQASVFPRPRKWGPLSVHPATGLPSYDQREFTVSHLAPRCVLLRLRTKCLYEEVGLPSFADGSSSLDMANSNTKAASVLPSREVMLLIRRGWCRPLTSAWLPEQGVTQIEAWRCHQPQNPC